MEGARQAEGAGSLTTEDQPELRHSAEKSWSENPSERDNRALRLSPPIPSRPSRGNHSRRGIPTSSRRGYPPSTTTRESVERNPKQSCIRLQDVGYRIDALSIKRHDASVRTYHPGRHALTVLRTPWGLRFVVVPSPPGGSLYLSPLGQATRPPIEAALGHNSKRFAQQSAIALVIYMPSARWHLKLESPPEDWTTI